LNVEAREGNRVSARERLRVAGVGSEVGKTVGGGVGDKVGKSVGDGVGDKVGKSLGECVGKFVGSARQEAAVIELSPSQIIRIIGEVPILIQLLLDEHVGKSETSSHLPTQKAPPGACWLRFFTTVPEVYPNFLHTAVAPLLLSQK